MDAHEKNVSHGSGAPGRSGSAEPGCREQTLHGAVPFSLLATAMLAASVLMLGGTFLVEEPVYRFFFLGAYAALLGATVVLLVVTKLLIWPSAITLRR